jgi:hypothetical protein
MSQPTPTTYTVYNSTDQFIQRQVLKCKQYLVCTLQVAGPAGNLPAITKQLQGMQETHLSQKMQTMARFMEHNEQGRTGKSTLIADMQNITHADYGTRLVTCRLSQQRSCYVVPATFSRHHHHKVKLCSSSCRYLSDGWQIQAMSDSQQFDKSCELPLCNHLGTIAPRTHQLMQP